MLDQVRSRYEFQLVGSVVMPEHVHLLISEPRKGNPSKVLQVMKQKGSRALHGRPRKSSPAQLSMTLASSRMDAQAFWQRRFYDFNVWSRKKRKEKLEYLHAHPVTRKLVQHPRDWPWSSWWYYETGEDGLIRIDPVEEETNRGQNRHSVKKKSQTPHP